MREKSVKNIPIVYSCSGCSSAAQLANALAVRLDRAGVAEMSCIAGVGGDVASLVRVAKSGRAIAAIDGCPLACVKSCLARHGVEPTVHQVLSDFGIRKKLHEDFDPKQADEVYDLVAESIKERG
ncbi:MAG: putative zinc-binding protein [Bdellovibrionales bacterium]|nr:putative zinc-binding protein [Bdellovibrionales bacterium]